MKETPAFAILREPFIAGTDENLSPVMHHLWKLEGGAIYFCRKGWAHATIDLKDYEIVKNTQVVLLPGTIICINGCSSDFTASFFEFPKEMFMEACMRFEPIFFRFIKEQPCYVPPQKKKKRWYPTGGKLQKFRMACTRALCLSTGSQLLCRQTVHFYQISDWYLQSCHW
jgi:transcriptional regulator